MRVLIAAGGTGGHIYPGIAVAKEIFRRKENNVVRFVGDKSGLETKLIPDNGFELSLIKSSGLKNVGVFGKIKGLYMLPRSFIEASRIISNFKPDVVVGTGGYVTGSVLLMASLKGIPTLAMDSNALPGFTNRVLARFVTKAALTFEEALPYFGKKGFVTGNPVRKGFFEIGQKPRTETFNLLIFGGSQGARGINFAMIDALSYLKEHKKKLSITHQTGKYDLKEVKKKYADASWKLVNTTAYISDMISEFGKADLIISRAGATTSAELAASGKAAIMVPLPTAADDHQRNNAEALQNAGAAKMILQKDLSGELLATEILELMNYPEKLASMEESARGLAKVNAAEVTVDLIEELAENLSE